MKKHTANALNLVKWGYMKKITLFVTLLLLSSAALQARTVDVSAAYIGASHFDQARVSAVAAWSLNVLAGVEAKYVKENAFKDPVYSVNLPIELDFGYLKLDLKPFYYFKNKSQNESFQDSSAYGVSTRLIMTLEDDTVNDLYTHAYLGASFARQKGTLAYADGTWSNEDYSQFAYTLGLTKNFFRRFGFEAAGTVFQYPNGIEGVKSFRGIMDQQELAPTQTYDVVHDLGKYALGARMTWMWPDSQSSLYLGYRYGEFYTADPEHSFMAGNTFAITRDIHADLAYNHVRTVHNDNKRDILHVRLVASF